MDVVEVVVGVPKVPVLEVVVHWMADAEGLEPPLNAAVSVIWPPVQPEVIDAETANDVDTGVEAALTRLFISVNVAALDNRTIASMNKAIVFFKFISRFF